MASFPSTCETERPMMPMILVVEDNSDLRSLYRQALEAEGYETRLASNGKEALEQLAQMEKKPGLILLDLMMPIMDGKEFLTHQEKDPGIQNIPVVICSATRAGLGSKYRFLRKPVDLDIFLSLINEFFSDKSQ